jgi:type IX secretion system PorP/SprF family membrane protein
LARFQKFIAAAALCLFSFTKAYSQDIHYSQHWASPLYANPANTGHFIGDWRLAGIYRNQWRAISGNAFNSLGASYDMQHIAWGQNFNSGIIVVADQSGSNYLRKSKAYLSGSYHIIAKGHKIGIGLQPGIVNISSDISKLRYDSQFDLGNGSEVFNPDMPSGEASLMPSKTYFDLNAGLLWTKRINPRFRPQAGLSFHHLTMPNQSLTGFSGADARVPVRYGLHLSAAYKAGDRLMLHPLAFYSSQRRATEIIVGGNAELLVQQDIVKSIYAGPHFRYGLSKNYDASIWVLGAKIQNFDVSISYDINISKLSAATSNRGAFEISVVYISKSTKPTKIFIPCDRL